MNSISSSALKGMVKKAASSFGVEVGNYSTNRKWLNLNNTDFETIVDVGANRGQFLSELLTVQSPKLIHCFEPIASEAAYLSEIKSQLVDSEMHIHQAGASEEAGTAVFNIQGSNGSASSLLSGTNCLEKLYGLPAETNTVSIDLVKIDDVIPVGSIKGNLLMKFDCQGYDYLAMKGGSRTLKVAHTCIVEYCVSNLYEGQSKFVDIVDLAAQSGLVFVGCMSQHYAPEGSVAFLDAVFQREDETS